jgi:hypothetical protein
VTEIQIADKLQALSTCRDPETAPNLRGQKSKNTNYQQPGSWEKKDMASQDQTPRHVALYRQAKNFAMGEHPLSKYGSPVLLLLDALLCSLIISKVACK